MCEFCDDTETPENHTDLGTALCTDIGFSQESPHVLINFALVMARHCCVCSGSYAVDETAPCFHNFALKVFRK